MKYIVKKGEPREFADWKAMANDDWQPAYGDLRGSVKEAVKISLMEDSHIEHFLPQNAAECDALDFANMLCSCQSKLRKGEPRHCGNLKGKWFEAELLVSPLAVDCENRFAFTGDGGIGAADRRDLAARETIERLGLDIPKLKDLRAKAIEPFLEADLAEDGAAIRCWLPFGG